jgi:alginate O-acetyltransferase complex protein AlgI
MPFNTYTFIIFFSTVLVGYYSLPSWTLRKIFLCISGYLFYAAWNPLFVTLLIFSTLFDWSIAKQMVKRPAQKKILLILSIVISLSLLGVFKYGELLLTTFTDFAAGLGWEYQAPAWKIILPVGISFYTFQTMSYIIDVYRNKVPAAKSFLDYALYVSFFPQLVAGPIVRSDEFLPQCETLKPFNLEKISFGLCLLVIGLFMKIILSDAIMAPVADLVFNTPANASTWQAWCGVLAFSGQIFFDFCGYTLCAIAAAITLGFKLPENFRAPYAALGFADFWQRWHISLSRWLRDYLYISLGGNRISPSQTAINLMITMMLGGLWHGASWLFLLWGGIHGTLLIAERLCKHLFKSLYRNSPIFNIPLCLLTTLLICLTWIPFRASSLSDMVIIIQSLIGLHTPSTSLDIETLIAELVFVTFAALFAWHFFRRDRDYFQLLNELPANVKLLLITTLLLIIYLFGGGDDRAFIYFQF